MTLAEAKAIYRAKYWDAQRCDELPAGVDDAVFDYGVNSGIGRSGKVLRRCLNLPDNTSVVNDAVIAAAIHADASKLVTAICDERLRFLQALRTWPVFGKGWGRRVAEVKAFSLQLAAKQPVTMPDTSPQVQQSRQGRRAGAKRRAAGLGRRDCRRRRRRGQPGAFVRRRRGLIALIVALAVGAAIAAYAFWQWRQRQQQEAMA